MSKLKGTISNQTNISGKIGSNKSSVSVNMQSGARGKSAYEIWLDEGNKGDKEDFLESLKVVTSEYNILENKPSIENIELIGNKTFEELGVTSIERHEIGNLL